MTHGTGRRAPLHLLTALAVLVAITFAMSIQETAHAAPTAVQDLRVTMTTADTISIAWDAPSDFGTGASAAFYYVQRRTPGGTYITVADALPTNARFYTDTGLRPGTLYEYNVYGCANSQNTNCGPGATLQVMPDFRTVPSDWALLPPGIQAGQQFRLLFVSSSTRGSRSADIDVYNTFVQNRAAAGHQAIQRFSDDFRAVACTAAVNARQNTGTTGTGVPIYWLNGVKVADDYDDFYDGGWDNVAGSRTQTGGANSRNSVVTGCNSDGTTHGGGRALGGSNPPRAGTLVLKSLSPLSDSNAGLTQNMPLYGLSPVLTMGAGAAGDYDVDNDGLIEVSNLEQLNAIRWDLNGNGASDSAANHASFVAAFPDALASLGCGSNNCTGYELARDLDFEDAGSYASGSVNTAWTTGDGWRPLGDHGNDSPFRGTFEGNGRTISNLFIDRKDWEGVGLFALTHDSTEIRSVGLVDVDVHGNRHVGGLVGDSEGSVRFAYVTGQVQGYKLDGINIGGLVGSQHGDGDERIAASWSSADITGHDGAGATNLGGLVGDLRAGRIIASYATGDVQASANDRRRGGLVGNLRDGAHIIASYSIGSVTPAGGSHRGGLVGRTSGTFTVTDGYWDMWTTGIINISPGPPGAGYTTSQLQSPTAYGTGNAIYADWNVNVDGQSGNDDPWNFGTASEYPALQVDFNGDGHVTAYEFGEQGRAANFPPSFTGPSTFTVRENETAAGTVTATEDDQDSVTFTVTGGDDQALFSIDGATGALTFDTAPDFENPADDGGNNDYRVVVTATGGAGARTLGVTRAYSVRVTDVDPPSAPDAPSIGTATDTTLALTWSAPAETGDAPITDYDVRYRAGTSGPWTEPGHGVATSRTLTNLTPGTSYQVQVQAENSEGESDWSTAATGTTFDYDTDDDNLIEVSSPEQLNAMRWDLDGDGSPATAGASDYAAAFPDAAAGVTCAATCEGYELAADLDFDDASSYASGSVNSDWTTGAGWEPIGTSSGSFTAEFNGGGHVIRNLFIDRDNADNVGLFGHAGRSSQLLRVGLEDADVTGQHQVGILVGYTAGEVSFSYSSGRVTGNNSAGGLVGEMKSPADNTINEINASYSTARVRGRENVGGLVGVTGRGGTGSDRSAVVASYAVGSVGANPDITSGTFRDFGGLVGWCRNCEISASYARGAVDGGAGAIYVGGLVGGATAGVSIASSYFDSDSSGRVFGNGLNDSDNDNVVDSGETNTVPGKTTADLQAPTSYAGIYANWNVDVDGVSGNDDPWDFGTASQYPGLQVDSDGDATPSRSEFGGQFRPDAPAAPTVEPTSGSDASLDVSWTAPADRGTRIVDYDVQYREGTSGDWTGRGQGRARTATIPNLDSGTPHQVQVRAQNAFGESDWSAPGTGTTSGTPPNTAPVFQLPTGETAYSFDLAENADGSSTPVTVGTVSATDADNDTVTYSIYEQLDSANNPLASDKFAIDSATGVITYVGSGEDFESLPAGGVGAYGLGVRASDGTVTTDVEALIDVTDVLERSVAWAGDFRETAANNGAVKGEVTATLTDDTFNANAVILVQSVSASNVPDGLRISAERTSDTVLTITLTGRATSHADRTVNNLTVTLGDGAFAGGDAAGVANSTESGIRVRFFTVNTVPEFGQASYSFTLAENADGSTTPVPLGTAAATDAEGDPVDYAFAVANLSKFAIDSSTGAITYIGAGEDFESFRDPAAAYALVVVAREDGDPLRRGLANVTVAVTDVNEPPGQPAAPTVTAPQPTRLEASWTPPANAGPPITEYQIQYSHGGTTETVEGIDPGAQSRTVDVPAANTAYSVQVRAVNDEGTGPWSASTSVTTPAATAPHAPEAPSVRATPGSRTSLDVSWEAPYDGGRAITGYVVAYLREGATGPWQIHTPNGTDTETSIDGLTPGARYEVQVRALNAAGSAGEGPWSPSSFGTAGSFTFSSPDTFSVKENYLRVGRVIARDRDGRAVRCCYTLDGADRNRFRISFFGDLVFGSRPDYENPRDTDRDNDYQIEVTVTLGRGDAAQSATQAITVRVRNVDRPAQIATPTITETRLTTSLGVDWEKPSSGGDRMTRYDIQYRQVGASRWKTIHRAIADWVSEDRQSRVTIVRLYENTSYDVRVRGVNSEGGGIWSDVVRGNTGERTVPGGPGRPTVVAASETSLRVRWEAPAQGASPITQYQLQYRPYRSGHYDLVAVGAGSTETTLTSLERNTRYEVGVRASNGSGWGRWSQRGDGWTSSDVPVADAGDDVTVDTGAEVTLEGSGSSDPDGDPLTYAWTQVSGEEVTLDGADTASPTFTAPAEAGTLQFTLVVSDRSAESAPDTVTVTVAEEGTPPVPPVDYDADGDNLIEVGSLAQLNAIRWDLDGDGVSEDRGYSRAFPNPEEGMGCASSCAGYELTGDIDLGSENWDPIGYQGSRDLDRSGDVPFTAVFEGNGYVIRNLFIDRPNTSGVGLFGVTGPGSEIRNVGILQANVTGYNNVAPLVGLSHGSVRYSWATGTATGRNVNVGGLIGHQRRGNGEMLAANWARVNVTGKNNLGGLVGILQQAELVASYAHGRVTCRDGCTLSRGGLVGSLRNGGSVAASYSTGAVVPATGGAHIGGLIGELRDGAGSVANSYWDTERSGIAGDGAGQGAGKTTSELRSPRGYTGIYAGWNVDLDGDGSRDNPWDFGPNGNDPVLRPTVESNLGADLARRRWPRRRPQRRWRCQGGSSPSSGDGAAPDNGADGGGSGMDGGAPALDAGPEPQRVPGAPRSLRVAAGNGSLAVSWSAPSDLGNPPVTGYQIYHWSDSVSSCIGCSPRHVGGSTTRTTISHLRAGTKYQVRVVAVNSKGSGPVAPDSGTPGPRGLRGRRRRSPMRAPFAIDTVVAAPDASPTLPPMPAPPTDDHLPDRTCGHPCDVHPDRPATVRSRDRWGAAQVGPHAAAEAIPAPAELHRERLARALPHQPAGTARCARVRELRCPDSVRATAARETAGIFATAPASHIRFGLWRGSRLASSIQRVWKRGSWP